MTKREAEQVVFDCVARGLDAVVVNPGFMLGPWDWKPSSGRMLLKIATGWAMLAPPGANSYCDVRDVAAGIVAALERGRHRGTLYFSRQDADVSRGAEDFRADYRTAAAVSHGDQTDDSVIGFCRRFACLGNGTRTDVNSASDRNVAVAEELF